MQRIFNKTKNASNKYLKGIFKPEEQKKQEEQGEIFILNPNKIYDIKMMGVRR